MQSRPPTYSLQSLENQPPRSTPRTRDRPVADARGPVTPRCGVATVTLGLRRRVGARTLALGRGRGLLSRVRLLWGLELADEVLSRIGRLPARHADHGIPGRIDALLVFCHVSPPLDGANAEGRAGLGVAVDL